MLFGFCLFFFFDFPFCTVVFESFAFPLVVVEAFTVEDVVLARFGAAGMPESFFRAQTFSLRLALRLLSILTALAASVRRYCERFT